MVEPECLLEELILPTINHDISYQPNKVVKTKIKILNREVNPYFCIYCRTSYHAYEEFCQHNESVHNIYQYSCNMCNKSYQDVETLERHIAQKHMKTEDSGYTSMEKGIHFENISHETIKTEENVFDCKYCSETSDTLENFLTHLDSHETCYGSSKKKRKKQKTLMDKDKKYFVCKYCSASFATVADFTTHLKVHPFQYLEIKRHTCLVCFKTFSRNQHLTRHMETVHMNVMIKCPFCSMYIKRKDHLLRHIREVHNSYGRITVH